jgi:hypothetical protein
LESELGASAAQVEALRRLVMTTRSMA